MESTTPWVMIYFYSVPNTLINNLDRPTALKSEALAYRFTADETDKTSTFDRVDMIYAYHGMPSGAFAL